MPPGQSLVETLRGWAAGGSDERSDGELLERFAAHDGDAFASLVRRHGPLVWGVCRRVLRREQDAEDAFQATFLVLARGASSVRRRESVRSWLYGVALRVALRARDQASRRREAPPVEVLTRAEDAFAAANRAELALVLDEEVGRLPERYRLPLVLCYLLGRTNDEAARELGCPRGTVAVRLARARDRLRRRLLLRGLGPAGALPLMPSPALPPRGIADTTRTAVSLFQNRALVGGTPVTLAQGVLSNMFFNKCKMVAAVILAVGLLAAVIPAGRTLFAQPPPVPTTQVGYAPVPEKKKEEPAERSATLRKLLQDRETAALTVWKNHFDQFVAGRGALDITIKASHYVLKSGLELSRTKEQRLAAIQAQIDRIKMILDINQARFNAGRASIADLEMSRYEHLDAEIELEREKSR
jgi:RNA polymerase sigma factor (sigma-70 family)